MYSTLHKNVKPLFWTEAGLKKLGQIIYESRNEIGSLNAACDLIGKKTGIRPAATTLSAIEKGHSKPEWNTLAAIAYAGFVEFGGRKLNIFDFIAIASEQFMEETPMRRLVEDQVEAQGITLEEFAETCSVAIEDLQTILNGGQTRDYSGDLILMASYLINPSTKVKFRSYLELLEYCGMARNEQTRNWELSHKVESA